MGAVRGGGGVCITPRLIDPGTISPIRSGPVIHSKGVWRDNGGCLIP
jgi:hypothetical protein